MTFSKEKLSLRPEKSRALSTFLIALLMAAALFLPYMFFDDGYFLFFGDFNVQQVPFYQHCHELVKSGNIGWDFGTDLGANFIGSYTFYLLGSPFFWVTLLFPNSFVPYLMGPLLILKFACCALSAYFYLQRFLKSKENARFGAILYAFSGFSVYNIFFNHFHEALIIFPLLLLAIELLITENRRGLVTITVFFAAIMNYFFFFGMVVFAVIYWFIRMYSGAIKTPVKRFFVLLFESALGVLLSAAILLPTVLALSGNGRISEFQSGWGALVYGKEQIYANIFQCFFFPPDLPARPVFFPSADVKWSSLGGWLPVISMVGVFAWTMQKKGHWLKRVIATMAVMAMVPLLNSSFYMFNTAYYARWFYMPILMMCLASCMAIEDRTINWDKPFKWVFAITVGITLIIGLMPAGFDEDGKVTRFGIYMDDANNLYATRFWITCLIAIIGLLLFRIALYFKKNDNKAFLRVATAATCVIAVIYASVFIGFGKTHSYDSKTVMIDRLIEGEVDLPGDKEDFRIDCYECVDNTGMYLDYSSINAFHSIVPVSVTEFYEFVGEERGVASRPSTESAALRSLLSVRYMVDMVDSNNFKTDSGYKLQGYKFLKTEGGFEIYENENYIPYGFTYEYYINREEALYYGKKSAPAMMVKAMLLEPAQVEKYKGVLKPLTSDYSFEYNTYKEQIILTSSDLAEDAAKRAATAAYDFSQSDNGFKAKINLERENLVFFSVPYDEGWSAYVNGEKVEIEKVNIGFMAVLAPKGNNEIEFVYETPGLSAGIVITLGSALMFIAYLVVCFIINKRKPQGSYYPEGEMLLKQWRDYELEDALSAQAKEEEQPDLLDMLDSDSSVPTDNFPGGFKIIEEIVDKEENNE